MRPSIPYDPRVERSKPPGWLATLGRWAIDLYAFWAGSLWTLFAAVSSVFTPGRAAANVVRRVCLMQVFFTAVQGLPVVTVTAVIIGATIMVQTVAVAPGLPGEVVGKLLVAVLLRELAPLVTAIIVASRSGSAIATELGNMKASLEVLGLASLGIDAPRYVVFPRLVGVVVGVLALMVYFGILAFTGSFFVAWVLGAPSLSAMQQGLSETLGFADLALYALKGAGCGIIVGWICCHFGLQVGSSPTEVPVMTGQAVIRSVLLCVLFNFFVTVIFYSLWGLPTQ